MKHLFREFLSIGWNLGSVYKVEEATGYWVN